MSTTLVELFKAISNVKHLGLSMLEGIKKESNKKDFLALNRGLSSLTQLQEFSFDYSGPCTKKVLDAVTTGIPSTLRSLDIFWSNSTCSLFESFTQMIKRLTNLQELRIETSIYRQSTEELGIPDFLESLKNFPQMKNLALVISSTKVYDASLIALANSLPHLKSLECLELQFGPDEFTDEGMNYFANSKCLRHVKELCFDIEGSHLTYSLVNLFSSLVLINSYYVEVAVNSCKKLTKKDHSKIMRILQENYHTRRWDVQLKILTSKDSKKQDIFIRRANTRVNNPQKPHNVLEIMGYILVFLLVLLILKSFFKGALL